MSDENTKSSNKTGLITKSVSMPMELFLLADARIQAAEELDWSKYVRKLIRRDLNLSGADAGPLVPTLTEKAEVPA